MRTRYMERTNSISERGKRTLESGDDEEQQPDKKRPALASVIVEALKLDSLQKLCSSLEPILRRVVSEEVERALAKLGPARLDGSKSEENYIANVNCIQDDPRDETRETNALSNNHPDGPKHTFEPETETSMSDIEPNN